MTYLRIVTCDDDPLALDRLSCLLAGLPETGIVATARNGAELLAAVTREKPHLLLVDIDMPGIDGLDVTAELASSNAGTADMPLVAFVTAFRHFASEAFDNGAVDFLSKPVRLERLEQTLGRARRLVEGRLALGRPDGNDGVSGPSAVGAVDPDHLWISRRGEVVRLDLDRVDHVVAEGSHVRLFAGATSYLYRASITALEQRLDPGKFIRTHRSHIVRIDQISSIRRVIHGGSELLLSSQRRVPLGRRFAREARKRLLLPG